MDTRARIVACADRLQRRRGYAGWSFGDVSDEVGVRRASIHHHFPTKGALLVAVVGHHLEVGRATAEALSSLPPAGQLRAFLDGYRDLLAADTICACGALTVDLPGFPEEARAIALRYVEALRGWVTAVLAAGQGDGSVRAFAPPEAQAQLVLSALQGALQHARADRDPARLSVVVEQLGTLLLEAR